MKIDVGEAPAGYEFTGDFRSPVKDEWYMLQRSPAKSDGYLTGYYPILRKLEPPKTIEYFVGKKFTIVSTGIKQHMIVQIGGELHFVSSDSGFVLQVSKFNEYDKTYVLSQFEKGYWKLI